jgi:hypothetical protein
MEFPFPPGCGLLPAGMPNPGDVSIFLSPVALKVRFGNRDVAFNQ